MMETTSTGGYSETLWQRVATQPNFDSQKLAAAVRKNQCTSYGLTLVLGCPLPADLTSRIKDLERFYEELAPGLIRFVAPEAYHLTVYGLKRSRPNPFSLEEVRPVLEGLHAVLETGLSAVPNLVVPLQGSVVTDDGAVMVLGQPNAALSRLRAALGQIEGVDSLKGFFNHVSIGQFAQPLGSPEAYRRAVRVMERVRDLAVGTLPWRTATDNLCAAPTTQGALSGNNPPACTEGRTSHWK